MTKEEMRNYLSSKFTSMGYRMRKSIFYKVYDDDYLIAFELRPTGKSKGYYFTCGVIYLPDELKFPVRGVYDLQWDFIFPWEPVADFDLEVTLQSKLFRRVFDYEKYSLDVLNQVFMENYRYFMIPLLDKNYGLDIFRNDWRTMKRFSAQSIDKLCRRAGLDTQMVLNSLGK